MKKLMWGISVFALVLTAVVLQFMPDSVPMHYDLAGNIDRWGSKYENLLFPVIILFLSLHWHVFIAHFEKKAGKASAEKDRAEALSNAKVLNIVGVSMAAVFTVMQGYYLFSAYAAAKTNAAQAPMDIGKLSCILIGVLLIVLGNFLPKTKKNRIAGIRVSWSMYNDITWRKSNCFGAVAIMIAGLLTILTAAFVRSSAALVLLIVYILIATSITLIYSYKVYKEELSAGKTSEHPDCG